MRISLTSLFIITILLTACGAQAPAPVVTSPVASTQPAIVAPSNTPTAAYSPTPAPSATPAATFTPTVPPPPPVIGLDNFSQLVQLHDYTPDLDAVTGMMAGDYSPLNPVFSPDSMTFAVPVALSTDKRALYILDVATGDLVSSIPLADSVTKIYSCNFNPDGQKLIYSTLSTGGTGTISIWDMAKQKLDRILWSKKGSSASDTAFSPDGKQITAVVGSLNLSGRGESLMVWDAVTGDQLKNFPADAQYGVNISKFNADGGRMILSTQAGGQQLTVYDTSTWQVLTRISPPDSAAEVAAISPDGAFVLTSRQSGGHILLWDAGTGKLISALDNPFDETVSMEFSPEGSMLVVSGVPPFKPHTDNMYLDAGIWDTSTWKQVGIQHWGKTDDLLFAPDGRSMLARSHGSVYLIGFPDQEIQVVDQTLVDFTAALSRGDYAAAAPHFFINDLERTNLKNKGLTTDPAAILEAICTKNAFPCLPATVTYTSREPGESRASAGYYRFLVRFMKPDGSVYADANGATIFDMAIAQDTDGSFKVFSLVIDVVAVMQK